MAILKLVHSETSYRDDDLSSGWVQKEYHFITDVSDFTLLSSGLEETLDQFRSRPVFLHIPITFMDNLLSVDSDKPGKFFAAIYRSCDFFSNRSVFFSEGYLLNDEGKTVEHFI